MGVRERERERERERGGGREDLRSNWLESMSKAVLPLKTMPFRFHR